MKSSTICFFILYSIPGEAEKKFEILKKRFSRKRIDAKRARMSGIGHYDISTAKKAYEEYSFLAWYEPYIRDKRTSLDVAPYDECASVGRQFSGYDDDDMMEEKINLHGDHEVGLFYQPPLESLSNIAGGYLAYNINHILLHFRPRTRG